jgi:hypothetical protein
MGKKEVQLRINGRQRPDIDVELMTQAIIALGRELAERNQATHGSRPTQTTAAASS